MRRVGLLLGVLLAFGLAGSASAAEFAFHGDLNNRFLLYTDQIGMFNRAESILNTNRNINDDTVDEAFGDVKYRLWAEASTNDGKVKGVYAIELGALRYGFNNPGTVGGDGAFSGDGINIETRWAYTDFQLPFVESKARVTLGLQNVDINYFFWRETAMGVQLHGSVSGIDYNLGYIRGVEDFNDSPGDDAFEDLDNVFGKVIFKPAEGVKASLFVVYQGRNPGDDDIVGFTTASQYQIKRLPDVNFDIVTVGTDGSWSFPTTLGNAFINWDFMYQGGSLDDNLVDRDVSAFFAHADLGVNIGAAKITYTGWYASGDDDPNDGDVENFMSTDVDMFDSIIFFEGGFTDDNYFTEAPHILDKGLIFNKIALDYQATKKTKVGVAVLYLITAEDLEYVDDSGKFRDEDTLGTEIDVYLSHKLYGNLEFAINAGYLIADDGMDFFETTGNRDGDSDSDIFRSTARVRYKF